MLQSLTKKKRDRIPTKRSGLKKMKWTMRIQSLKGTSKVVGAKICREVIGI